MPSRQSHKTQSHGLAQRALFLDRDGVINVDSGYVHKVEQFQFIRGIFHLCRTAQDLNFQLIVITNQAGIAKGYYTECAYHHLTDWMKQRFEYASVTLRDVYFCPYHARGIGQYKRDSELRKPKPGMLLLAARDHHIDLSHSLLVGDRSSDILAGQAADVRATVRYCGHGSFSDNEFDATPDIEFDSHNQIATWLTENFSAELSGVVTPDGGR